jgi:hypothetical protein
VIRRLFWLSVGAAAGIAGYRRAERLARRRGLVGAARGVARFARDVRDGMDEYMDRHPRPQALPSTNRNETERHGNGVG